MSNTSIPILLGRALSALAPGAIMVAYSGGADSHVLLHALAQNADARQRGLRALHIDHGLHADSSRWVEHCRKIAAQLDVAFDGVCVDVERAASYPPGHVGVDAM